MIHVAGKVDPVEDTDVINFELALADITQIEKRVQRIEKGRAKSKEEIASNEVRLCSTYIWLRHKAEFMSYSSQDVCE